MDLLKTLKDKKKPLSVHIAANEMVSFIHFFLTYGEGKNTEAYDATCPEFKEDKNLRNTLTEAKKLPIGIKILLSESAHKYTNPSELLDFIKKQGTDHLKAAGCPDEEIKETSECLNSSKLPKMLETTYPLYHEHFWEKNKTEIERFSNSELNSEQLNIFNSCVNQISSFLKTPVEKTPSVFSDPVPRNASRSSSRKKDYICLGFYLGKDTLSERLPTLTHELFHELYAYSSSRATVEESLGQRDALCDFFEKFPQEKAYKTNSPERAVKNLFNETMACAFQALHQEKQTGIHSPKLYDNPMVHSCASKMLPVLKEYLSDKKTLDLEFINSFKTKALEACNERKQELKNPSDINANLKSNGRQP